MVAKLLFRIIDREVSVDRKAVFRDNMTKLKVPLLGLRSVTAGFNAILEKEDVDPLLTESIRAHFPPRLGLIGRYSCGASMHMSGNTQLMN